MKISPLKVAAVLAMVVSQCVFAKVPGECIQAPSRTNACPHELYRVASIAVPSLSIPKGDMVCLCLTDLTDLPDQEQAAAFKQIADEYALTPLALFQLLERSPAAWVNADQ